MFLSVLRSKLSLTKPTKPDSVLIPQVNSTDSFTKIVNKVERIKIEDESNGNGQSQSSSSSPGVSPQPPPDSVLSSYNDDDTNNGNVLIGGQSSSSRSRTPSSMATDGLTNQVASLRKI